MKTLVKISACLTLFVCSLFAVNAEFVLEISPEQTVTVTVSNGNMAILKFVPAVSGKYCFTSICDYDTAGFVFDENMNILAEDEISGEGNNFFISYDFTADTTYYLGAKHYLDSFKGSFDIRLVSENHVHSYKSQITKNPTCDTEGIYSLSCRCGDVITEKIPALGHNFITSATTATCTTAGKSILICQTCGFVETKAVAALGHSYGTEMVIDKEPTCTAAGSKSYHCIRCDKKTDSTSIPALGHDFSDVFTVDKAATCTAQGQKSRHCTRCTKVTDTTAIAATGHTYGSFKTTKSPTCTARGEKTKTCIVCASVKKEYIAALGHSYSSKYTVDKKSTTDSSGYKTRHCIRCSSKTDKVTIPKISKLSLSSVSFVYNSKSRKPVLTVSDSTGAKLKAGTDYDSQFPKSSKSIGSYTVTVTFKGNYSGKKTLTYKIIPANVSGIKASQTKASVTLSWKAVSGSVKYRVYKYSLSTKEYTALANTSKTTFKVKNLKAGTDYIFAVRAYKTVNNKTYISESFTKASTATVPGSVSLKAKKSGGGAMLTWKSINCTGYIIYMSQSKNGTYRQIKNINGYDVTGYFKSNLASSKKYYFKIRAYKKVGDKMIYAKLSSPVAIG